MVSWISPISARQRQHASRWKRTCAAFLLESSPSTYCSRHSLSGCDDRYLFMARLPQFLDCPLQKFAHGRRLDANDRGDLTIADPRRSQPYALPLLLGEPFDGRMHPLQSLTFEECLLRIGGGIGELLGEFGSPFAGAAFSGSLIERQVVSHAKEPCLAILDSLSFIERHEKAQKGLLRGLLRAGRLEADGQRVAVHVEMPFRERVRDE